MPTEHVLPRRDRLTLNAKIVDALLRHRQMLIRAENGIVADTTAPLKAALRAIEKEIASLAPRDLTPLNTLRAERLAVLRDRLNHLLAIGSTQSWAALRTALRQIVKTEHQAQANILQRLLPDQITLDLVGPDEARITAMLDQPLGGKLYADRLRANYGETTQAMSRELATSIAQGEGMAAAARRLREVVQGLSIVRATVLARSEIQRVANQTAENLYHRNRDVIMGVQWIGTLDSRTCPICGGLDGQTWTIDDNAQPTPPAHAQCRCFKAPVTRSFQELGLDADELPVTTRASMNGQVAAKLSYTDWFTQQDEAFQQRVLGPTRFQMWKAGRLTFDGMVRDLKVVPLRDLATTFPVAPIIY